MSHYLCLTARFFTGRYHGKEWPPSPGRYYQALVAGAKIGVRKAEFTPDDEAALRWLEQLDPPDIFFPKAEKAFAYKTFVPNNDMDAVIRSQMSATPRVTAATIKTSKTIEPWVFVEPDSEPTVHYVWRIPESDSGSGRPSRLIRLSRQLIALGWGIDHVAGNGFVVEGNDIRFPGERYILDDGSSDIKMLAPMKGLYDNLIASYAAFIHRSEKVVDASTRPTHFRMAGYRQADAPLRRRSVAFDLRTDKGSFRSVAWEDAMLVAAWLRHATAQRMRLEEMPEDTINGYVLGHFSDGAFGERLAYLPLPSIGHEHSDGRYRRALIALPFRDSKEHEHYLRRMAGDPLVAENGTTEAWLTDPEDTSLIDDRYLVSSDRWSSVTPVVLHGFTHVSGKLNTKKLDKLLFQAFEESGYPASDIEEFSCQPAPFWRGAGTAYEMRAPAHLEKWPKFHVSVKFRHSVPGPVLVGIGRHCGLGLFAAP